MFDDPRRLHKRRGQRAKVIHKTIGERGFHPAFRDCVAPFTAHPREHEGSLAVRPCSPGKPAQADGWSIPRGLLHMRIQDG